MHPRGCTHLWGRLLCRPVLRGKGCQGAGVPAAGIFLWPLLVLTKPLQSGEACGRTGKPQIQKCLGESTTSKPCSGRSLFSPNHLRVGKPVGNMVMMCNMKTAAKLEERVGCVGSSTPACQQAASPHSALTPHAELVARLLVLGAVHGAHLDPAAQLLGQVDPGCDERGSETGASR